MRGEDKPPILSVESTTDLHQRLAALEARLAQSERREEAQRHNLAIERIHHAIFAMEQVGDIEHIVHVVAQELKEIVIAFDAIGLNVIDEAAGTITCSDLLTGDLPIQVTVNPLEPPTIQELIQWWRRNEVWARESDQDFMEVNANNPSYTPAVVIDAPFSEGTLVVGLKSTVG
jgi:hypothetical protein